MQSAPGELFEWASALISQAHPFEAGRQLTKAEVDWLTSAHACLSTMPRADIESALDLTKALVSYLWRHRPSHSDGLPVQWLLTPISALRASSQSLTVDFTNSPASCAVICGYLDSTELSTRGRLALQDGSGCMAAEWRTTDVSLLHSVVLLTKYSLVVSSTPPPPSGSRPANERRAANGALRPECTYLEVSDCIRLARPSLPGIPPSPPPLQFWAGATVLSVPQVALRASKERTQRMHLCGLVSAVSPLIDYSASQPSFFLVEVRDDKDFAVHVLFNGACVAWHPFLLCGLPHLLTNLKPSVLFKNKANEMRVLVATSAPLKEHWTYPYQLDSAQARLLTTQGISSNAPPRPRPDPAVDLSSPSKRQRGLQSPRRKGKKAVPVLASFRDTMSYSGTITALLGASMYVLDDELRLYLSHSNCKPGGRALAVGASVLVRKAHPIFDAQGQLRALGCCSYSNIEVAEFAPDKHAAWQPITYSAWTDIANQVSLTSYHWLVETAEVLALKFSSDHAREGEINPLRRQIIQTLIDQLGLSTPKRSVYTEFMAHSRSCQLWQPPYIPFEVLLLREVKGLVYRTAQNNKANLDALGFGLNPPVTAEGPSLPPLRVVTERTLPRGQLLIGRLVSNTEGELQLTDGSDTIPIVLPSEVHLCPSDINSILVTSRYVFFVRPGGRKELFITCCPSSRLQDSGAVLIRPTVVMPNAQPFYDNFTAVQDRRFLKMCFFYLTHKIVAGPLIDLQCLLLFPPSPAPPSSPQALPRACYPYNEHGKAEPFRLRALPALAALLQAGRCYWTNKIDRDNREGHPLLVSSADVHEIVFVAAENRSATFPASSAGCKIELLTSAPTLVAYAHRAEEQATAPLEFRATLQAVAAAGSREVTFQAQVVRTEVLTDALRKRYNIHNVRGIACYVRDPSGLEPYELPVFLYEEHAGGGPLSVLAQCGHALVPGAVATFRSFESSRGWPSVYTTIRSNLVIENLPTSVQEIDPLDRFRMSRQTTCLGEIVVSAKDTRVYRLRCRAELFKLALSWRCTMCGEPRVPMRRVPLSKCTCAAAYAVFSMEADFNLQDGTGEASIEVSGEAQLRRMFEILPSDETEMKYLKEQAASHTQARIIVKVVAGRIEISDDLGKLLQLPRLNMLLHRCADCLRPLIFYASAKPSRDTQPRVREFKLKSMRIRLELLSFEEVAPRAELRDLLGLIKKDVHIRSQSGDVLICSD